ncbi:MAG: TonB-dependent receptor [Deltaproteobacteria bacterium]|nr:TonB-dependent receptor [Deltaproteobacteria bacterium]
MQANTLLRSRSSRWLVAALLGTSALALGHLVDPTVARAQSATAGAIQGVVVDSQTGEKLAGVTVTVTSPSLQGTQTAITDGNGFFKISELPPGEYLVTYYYLDMTLERSGISVGVNKVTPGHQKIDQGKAGGEVVKITDSAPTIDPTSTTQGITIDKNYIKNIPVPGRTFESALGAAAGSTNDGSGGVSFSGSSGLENQYYVDGVNTTGLTFGTVGSPVINDFIEEIEVLTGGYNAEFGRATGGIVNVVTKSGSNELKGSIFGYWQPGQLTASSERTPSNASSIDATRDNGYEIDFGFEVGGPIIKDKLWFFVGFVPKFTRVNVTRTIKRQTDCRQLQADGTLSGCDPRSTAMGGFADSQPDVDPETGFYLTDSACGGPNQPECEVRTGKQNAYNILSKINYAANPENQGQLAVQVLPAKFDSPGIYGPITSGSRASVLTTDVSAKWTSKFNDNKTEIEAVIGWHRDKVTDEAYDPMLAGEPLQVLSGSSLWMLGRGGNGIPERPETLATCYDAVPGGPPAPAGVMDPYPGIKNCPMDTVPYVIGGPGSITNDVEQRRSARLGITQRIKAAGSHEFKAGIDVENNLSDKARLYSGGAFLQTLVDSNIVVATRWVQLRGRTDQGAMSEGRFDNRCRTPDPEGGGATGGSGTIDFVCDYLGGELGDPGTQVAGNTLNWSAYLRDSWQIQPNLTLNVGLRYEEQRMRYSSELQNQVDPLTGAQLGKNAMTLTGMFAPRVGLLYDWTKEGRSKIYAHWGRFYESIPMQINNRSFGGESNFRQVFQNATITCEGGTDPNIGGANGKACLTQDIVDGMPVDRVGASENLFGASGVLVAPGIKSQYMDEIIAGFEYELLDDLKVGVSYQNRRLGRVIEDVSTDGANTYIIANPGEWSADEEKKLVDRINRTDDPVIKNRLENQLELYKGIRIFDKPNRDYNALQFTLTRRFSKKLYVQGSYTYSKTEGNYGGLYSADNGQIDPNISSQYDLIELLGNRVGPLPQDRPHYIKLDGYYTFDFKKKGALTVGARARALSGIPTNALAGHYLYGGDESFLLPRGQLGRTDFEHGLDMHFGYGYDIGRGMNLEVFFDIYNIYNRQGTFNVDNTYAPRVTNDGDIQNANPVSGGTYEDLIWVKSIDGDGTETPNPIGKNPNFRNTSARYAPGYGRIGVRLTF